MAKFKSGVSLKENESGKKIGRRDFLKLSGLTVAAALVPQSAQAKNISLAGKKLAMVIDLQKCTGCGACTIGCKNENNVQEGVAWARHIITTRGKFPNVSYEHKPTLCNHCGKAPCARMCPTGAMHKADGDITMHDPSKCIGCKSCLAACPYVVISRNKKEPHGFWRSDNELIRGCTESPRQVAKKVKGSNVTPLYNPEREKNLKGSGLRYRGIVEKCTFCDHRVKKGKLPYCVEKCPADARIFGDLNDPQSKVNEILGKYKSTRLREHLGTDPKVFYVREYNPGVYFKRGKGSV